ncbi:hypothetical protein L226DRAFT_44966 [Lentinus tigrinus ALCF2SS1-7]|uniref:uncharacterized protein n=1 Tax=Lentinus tigrinus ALCF2SS1-7 TaxID=1328758 RepID=UPI001165C99C|nr:hypothetical protein L226DRAFT_44966 [Lentinus tigrinus ALCF2SS1-7]
MSLSDSDGLQVLFRQANRQIIHAAASSTFLLYDLVTTLDEEVEYVWSSANALPKYLYFISRYIGIFGQLVLATNLFPMFCFSYLMFCFGYLLFLLLSVELSLMLRIDALYGKSRRVRILLGFAFVTEMVTTITLNAVSFPTVERTLVPFPSVFPIRGCVLAVSPAAYKLSWVPILIFETLIFALNAIKCISYGPLDHTPLIYRLFRDGSAYYVISFIFMLVCTIAQFFKDALASVIVVWVSAVLSYSGCHLLLSIRKTAARRQRLEANMISADIPQIHMPGGTTSESESQSLEGSHPLHLGLGVEPRLRMESIELVPRRVSLHLSTEGSHASYASDSDWTERCLRDWNLVDGARGGPRWARKSKEGDQERDVERSEIYMEQGRESDDSTGVRWLRRWKP